MSKVFHAGNVIIVGFIAAAMGMLYLAYKTTTVDFDLAAKGDYYAMEMNVNDQHKAENYAAQLGRDFEVKENENELLISLPPRISNKIQQGKVEFYCYSNSANDKVATLPSSAEGHYSFAKADYMPGKNYNVKISFDADGTRYYKEIKID